MLLPQNIERIISFGGGVSIDASKYLPANLERFAAFAFQSGTTIIMRNCNNILPTALERIAAFGKGKVIFEFDK